MKSIILFSLVIFSISITTAQESDSAAYRKYFGFSASRVSGLGLTFGIEPSPQVNFQFTGGIFQTSSSSFSSYGLEIQYHLHNENNYKIYLGPSIGTFNEGDELNTIREKRTSEFVFGLAMGAAAPVAGIFDNRLRVSGTLYYPTFYKDNTINVGVGATIHFLF